MQQQNRYYVTTWTAVLLRAFVRLRPPFEGLIGFMLSKQKQAWPRAPTMTPFVLLLN